MWHCGKCGKVWDTYLLLNIIPDPDDPKSNIGQCDCGYRFHRDKWQIITQFSLTHHVTILHYLVNLVSFGLLAKPIKFEGRVSSVFLELDYSFMPDSPPVLYETMAWTEAPEKYTGSNWDFFRYLQNRYVTQEHAQMGHGEILDELRRGGFHIYYHKNYDGDMEIITMEKDWRNPLHGFIVGETVERGTSQEIH